MAHNPRIVIAGAGATGCFIGGLLAAAGHAVTLLADRRTVQEIRAHGLTLTDFDGMAKKVDADALDLSERPDCMSGADIILVTARPSDTARTAEVIASHARGWTPVISLQQGMGNLDVLRAALPENDLRAGMVPFDVVPMGQGCFHRAGRGSVVIGAGVGASAGAMAKILNLPDLAVLESADITGLQWGNFLINLNDALCALSGLTLHRELHNGAWRRLLADQWTEALGVLKVSNINPVATISVPVWRVPGLLRLPTLIFTRVAGPIVDFDGQTRTQMARDLTAGRKTEIDSAQGFLVRMGAEVGVATPISAMIVDVIKLAETANQGLPNLPVRSLRREI